MDLYEVVFKCKSVRKYKNESLAKEQLTEIEKRIDGLEPLFAECKIKMRIVGAQEIKGMLAAKAPHYLLVFAQKQQGYLLNAGFMLQQISLFLSSKGIGNCWLGMAKANEPAYEGMEFICMLAFGLPAEEPHRANIQEFDRKPLDGISDGEDVRIEAARLAPSAVNGQPWYYVCDKGEILVYRQKLNIVKAQIFERLNQIDMGIGLCHIMVASKANGMPFIYKEETALPKVKGFSAMGRVVAE